MKSISSVSQPLPDEEEEMCDEIWSEEEDLPFSDNLKDLLNLRMQLYSAAEYFELSYMNDDQTQIVIDTLKDYSIKAILNTVDHLGSVAYKVNDFVDEKVDEASGVELQVNSIEQRLKTCQIHMDHEGLHQQSLTMNAPRYHKRYLLPEGPNFTKSRTEASTVLANEDCWHQFRNSAQSIVRSMPSSKLRERPTTPSPPQAGLATETAGGGVSHKESEKRTTSPSRFPLPRSISMSSRPRASTSQSTNPSLLLPGRQKNSLEFGKSASVHLHHRKENFKGMEQNPSKTNFFLRALLRKHKPKVDEMLYTYLDEYS